MVFNKNITKIFELNENNNNDFLNNILNDNDEILILNKNKRIIWTNWNI